MSANKELEHRLTTVEIKVSEHCGDIKQIRKDINRVEDNLKTDIRTNHDLIVRVLDNEIPHLQSEIKNGNKFNGNWDFVKIIGGVSGILATLVLIGQNSNLIIQWLYNILHVFFSGI